MKDKDAIINSLSDALVEALIWLCVEGKEPPYEVPCAIQYDLWKHTKTKNKQKAVNIIKEAVVRVATPDDGE